MPKVDRILGFFPSFYRAGQHGKLLHHVVESLTVPLDEADTLLFRIQRAHRLKVAEEVQDIQRLAAALDLSPFHFEDLVGNRDLPYDEKLSRMRERIARIARVHLSGLGTPWAIMEATAIFLDATLVAEELGAPAIRHLDAGGYSHVATLEFGGPQPQSRQRLYLHENPLARRKVEPAARFPMDHWLFKNQSAESAPLILTVTGIGERTVCPTIFCPATGAGITFNGIVPDGKTLRIDTATGARIDDVPVDPWVSVYRGAHFEFDAFDRGLTTTEQGEPETRFDGDLEAVAPTATLLRSVPEVPVGQSDWYFAVRQGVFDATDFEYSVYATPEGPIGTYDDAPGFDASYFDFQPSALVGSAWDERQVCAFKLLLPAQRPPAQGAATSASAPSRPAAGNDAPSEPNPVSRIARILPRFRAAGVRSFIDAARPAWIVGTSILRNASAADGAGITGDEMVVRSSASDLYVEPQTAV